jgi:eukaryotic-like serine/threonine-protein kinase
MSMLQDLKPGDPQVIGPYRLRGQLGVGGMGRVFLGISADGQLAAVKVIRADLAADPEFRARFRREVAVARQVSSRFTAPVIGADTDGPVPWLATAYVAGPSLADAVAARGPLPVASVLRLAAGLAEGLSAIHAAGVVHRDLKPSNVMLAEDGPRVIDFGISQDAEASALTRTGLVVGSPGFMSPEQAEGGEIGPPSDVFSLGAVLAFAATGKGPFGSGSTPALVYRVVYSPPSLEGAPVEVRPLIERCLAKGPGQRPTVRDLLVEAGVLQPSVPADASSTVTSQLPAPATRTVTQPPVPAAASRTVTSLDLSGVPGPARNPSERRDGQDRRHRFWRPLAIASIAAGLLAASAAGGIALTASAHQPPAMHSGQAAPARMASSTTPASPMSAPSGANPSTAAAPSMSAPATEQASMPAPASTSPAASASPTPSAPAPASASPTASAPAPNAAAPGAAAPGAAAPSAAAPTSASS